LKESTCVDSVALSPVNWKNQFQERSRNEHFENSRLRKHKNKCSRLGVMDSYVATGLTKVRRQATDFANRNAGKEVTKNTN